MLNTIFLITSLLGCNENNDVCLKKKDKKRGGSLYSEKELSIIFATASSATCAALVINGYYVNKLLNNSDLQNIHSGIDLKQYNLFDDDQSETLGEIFDNALSNSYDEIKTQYFNFINGNTIINKDIDNILIVLNAIQDIYRDTQINIFNMIAIYLIHKNIILEINKKNIELDIKKLYTDSVDLIKLNTNIVSKRNIEILKNILINLILN